MIIFSFPASLTASILGATLVVPTKSQLIADIKAATEPVLTGSVRGATFKGVLSLTLSRLSQRLNKELMPMLVSSSVITASAWRTSRLHSVDAASNSRMRSWPTSMMS
jgi:hypothetical protein